MISSFVEELLRLDRPNINEFVHSEPMKLILRISDHGVVMHIRFHWDIFSNSGVIAL